MTDHRYLERFKHAALIRKYLLELDVEGMRRLDAHIWPHLPPQTYDERLHTMHAARAQMKMIPKAAREYSEQWLLERRGLQAKAVGVAVMALSPRTVEKAKNSAEAMVDAVNDSIKAGIDIDKDAAEVRRRMQLARKKA